MEIRKKKKKCKVWNSYSSDAEEQSLLGFYAVLSGKWWLFTNQYGVSFQNT